MSGVSEKIKSDPPSRDEDSAVRGDADKGKRKCDNLEEDGSTGNDRPSKRAASGSATDVSSGAGGEATAMVTSISETNNAQRNDSKKTDEAEEVLRTAKDIVAKYYPLEPVPEPETKLEPLNKKELEELQSVLEIDKKEGWRDDWVGVLAYLHDDIADPFNRTKEKRVARQSLLAWASKNQEACRLVVSLFRHVCSMKDTPASAKKILAAADRNSAKSLEASYGRTNFDPNVLAEDGWTTVRSNEPEGALGGAKAVGERIFWQSSPAIIVAYLHDDDIGDLWKAIYLDEDSGSSFDLEADELVEARRKYEKRTRKSLDVDARRSSRLEVNKDFSVKGIENGIVLAQSYERGSRQGVFWPARVRHASESSTLGSKRTSAKSKVEVVFLSPYWDVNEAPGSSRRVEGLSERVEADFSSGPLFSIETVDANEESIREYPFDFVSEIDIDELRTQFRFTGLPKSVFGRFVDSHRLAAAFRVFALKHIDTKKSAVDLATAGLFEAHPLAIRAPEFPAAALSLPFGFLLPSLPQRTRTKDENAPEHELEPVVQIKELLNSMKPPYCWGREEKGTATNGVAPTPTKAPQPDLASPKGLTLDIDPEKKPMEVIANGVLKNYTQVQRWIELSQEQPATLSFLHSFGRFVVANQPMTTRLPARVLQRLIQGWSSLKSLGEDAVALSHVAQHNAGSLKVEVVGEWRKASEELYKHTIQNSMGRIGGVTYLVTDLRCNGHRTSGGCFERSVRLPAAIKAARRAGLDDALIMHAGISDDIIDFVEEKVLPLAHSSRYLQKMKSRCLAARDEHENLLLTEDSDGSGGEDTNGTRGTWAAAVAAVGAAVTAVDKIMCGDGVNAFCLTRPPGHHAGRSLHPMRAVSNGFCILNTVACAAMYATMPASAGGYGLQRVCVIDIDVHHGNGTEDILCSTYDPRFLYISIHAGGAEINGTPPEEDDPSHELHDLASKSKGGGIFPGRCGDSSPHKGVLNIPLGTTVTPHGVGTVLVKQVKPAVHKFAPDLILMSTGFDAHKHDPMCLGGLSAEDFGFITEYVCQLANKWCSGRVISVLEGGYGVPCCRPQRNDLFLPPSRADATIPPRPQPSRLLDLGTDLPDDMDDQVPLALQRRLEKCHAEGFMECVAEHARALKSCNKRKL